MYPLSRCCNIRHLINYDLRGTNWLLKHETVFACLTAGLNPCWTGRHLAIWEVK
jgi:hypothetical protein